MTGSLKRGASLKRRPPTKKRKRQHTTTNDAPPPILIQPGSFPNRSAALDLEPAWLGQQGPLIYRTVSYVSEDGANPYQAINAYVKDGIQKIRLNSVQFLVSFYKFKTDQVIDYTQSGPGEGELTSRSITIRKGSYSKTELIAYFQREDTDHLQMAVSPYNGTVALYIPGTYTGLLVNFTNAQDFKNACGFDGADIRGSDASVDSNDPLFMNGSVIDLKVSVRGTKYINLALPNTIHFCSPAIHQLLRSRSVDVSLSQAQNSAIASIPINVNSGQYVMWQNPNPDFYDCYGSGSFLFSELSFRYTDGTLIDFNGTPWSCEFGLQCDDVGSQGFDRQAPH